ncbi:unnamed protein product, partial [Didymodactylos carnosus]
TLINNVNKYFQCLNATIDPSVQPSPFDAVELITYILKDSNQPVDILVLGTFTNIAEAIIRDRTIVSKIGTLYFSSGSDLQRRRIKEFLLPQIFDASGILVDDVSPNVWIDILAAQRVFAAGIRHIVIMP